MVLLNKLTFFLTINKMISYLATVKLQNYFYQQNPENNLLFAKQDHHFTKYDIFKAFYGGEPFRKQFLCSQNPSIQQTFCQKGKKHGHFIKSTLPCRVTLCVEMSQKIKCLATCPFFFSLFT